METVEPDNFRRFIRDQHALIHEPRSAGGGEGEMVAMKRIRTGVIMIAGDAEHRKAYGPDDFQGLGQLIGSVDEVPGKTDEIGLLFMDGRDDVFGETNISTVMQVGDMNELTRRSRYVKIKPRYSQPGLFQYHGIGERNARHSSQCQSQKAAPGHEIPSKGAP